MNSEKWKNLETVFDSALQLNPEERPGFLKTTCADDPELRREVESLLAADNVNDDFLQNDELDACMKVMAQETLKDTPQANAPFESDILTGIILNNRWEILDALDAGGMGQVYKARDREKQRLAVVKVLKKEARDNEWIVKKFRQEGDALGKINHKNVVELYERGTTPNGNPYLVIEFVEGVTLRRFINEHFAHSSEIAHGTIAEIVRQLGDAIDAIHQANLVHRDLKPENIIVNDKDGETVVKIIDFGIARLLDRSTVPGQIVGTIDYMAPEQLQSRDVSAATDVYALAAIAYEVITGRRPFIVPDNPPIAEKVAKLLDLQRRGLGLKPSRLRGNLPEEVDVVIANGLSFEASRRPTALQFSQQLAQLLHIKHVNPTFPRKLWWVAVPAMLILAVASWLVWKKENPPTVTTTPSALTAAAASQRGLAYSLTVKRQRDGKTIRVTGKETFDTGDEFRFNITPFESGALYILNEGISKNWNVLFPTPQTSNGDSRVAALQAITTGDNVFTEVPGAQKGKGTETIWIIWAEQPIPMLEKTVRQSFNNELQITEAADKIMLRRFIEEKAAIRPEVNLNAEQSQVTLKGEGEILVHLLKLEHIDWK